VPRKRCPLLFEKTQAMRLPHPAQPCSYLVTPKQWAYRVREADISHRKAVYRIRRSRIYRISRTASACAKKQQMACSAVSRRKWHHRFSFTRFFAGFYSALKFAIFSFGKAASCRRRANLLGRRRENDLSFFHAPVAQRKSLAKRNAAEKGLRPLHPRELLKKLDQNVQKTQAKRFLKVFESF
jgi:hypothetical protein